jgi:hypothetical protein
VSLARHDFDAVLKAMFRARGEARRIDVSDALGRQLYQAAGLGTDFDMAISAVRHCLRIRNQYSHCNWYDDRSGRLAFVNVEEIAKSNQLVNGFSELTRRYVDVPTLESQEQYFSYADALLTYANYQLRFQAGELREQIFAKPAQLAQPPRHL